VRREREQNGEYGRYSEEFAHRHGCLQEPPFRLPEKLDKPKSFKGKKFLHCKNLLRGTDAGSVVAMGCSWARLSPAALGVAASLPGALAA
jgi:hypothetical protein